MSIFHFFGGVEKRLLYHVVACYNDSETDAVFWFPVLVQEGIFWRRYTIIISISCVVTWNQCHRTVSLWKMIWTRMAMAPYAAPRTLMKSEGGVSKVVKIGGYRTRSDMVHISSKARVCIRARLEMMGFWNNRLFFFFPLWHLSYVSWDRVVGSCAGTAFSRAFCIWGKMVLR